MKKSSTLSPVKQALLQKRLKGASHGLARRLEIPRRPERGWAPLSFAQRQIWVLDQMMPGNPAYNMPYGFRLRGPLELTALENSFNEIIKRHETLRTTFAVADGEPRQLIHPDLRIQVNVTALDHLGDEAGAAALQTLASEESVRSFDLTRLPLIRISLFKLGEAEHVLVINLHHIVADGLSIGPMLNEVDTFYRAFTGGGDPRPPELAVQYGDFAVWQRQSLAHEAACARQVDFWRTQLNGPLPVLELAGDRPRPSIQSFKGSNVFFNIPTAQGKELRSLGEREGCTFFMTVLAAFQVLLQRYSGADDLIVGAPVAIRTPCELEPLIGLFLNMVALRCDLSGQPSFVEVLRRSRDTTLDAFSNSSLPLEALMKHLKIERDPSRNPIFQVALQVLPATIPRLGDLEITSFHFDLKFAQFDLTLHLYEEASGYLGRFEYCSDLFRAETIERLSRNFLRLLRAILRHPEQRISALPILNDAERLQVLEVWNETAAAYPSARCVHEMVEEQARIRPDTLAAECAGRKLSYRDLGERAESLARRLRDHGVQAGSLVAIYLERSIETIVGMLAVWKAGGAYVPIDPEYPAERVRFVLEDTNAAVVLTRKSLSGALPAGDATILTLDAEGDHAASRSGGWPQPSSTASICRSADFQSAVSRDCIVQGAGESRRARIGRRAADDKSAIRQSATLRYDATDAKHAPLSSPNQLAYVIYTSGSTGRPKGVPITHASLFNLICWHQQAYAVTPADRATQIAGLAFDASVWEIWPYLTAGAGVHIVDDTTRLNAGQLVTWLVERQITLTFLPTPLAEAALRENWPERTALRVLLTGGDRLMARPARKLPFRLVNHYGPTENTVVSTCAEVEPGHANAAPPIGCPVPNTQVYILDRHLQPVPIGVPGELHLGGAQLTAGYWNRPELTAEKFIPNPFRAEPGGRLYRTGDLARWLPDGPIEFLGRIDHQVKIRGFRIELGEIESILSQHPDVREVVVLAREDVPGNKRLFGYVATSNPPADLAGELRARLRASLPEYMVPSAFVLLNAFPLTPNGKIDRDRLPVPDRSGTTSVVDATPRTATEEILAGAWAEILGLERVGIEDNFFESGGHSLLAARVISRVRHALGVELPLRDLFAAPTVARLAVRIETLRAGPRPRVTAPPLELGAESGPAELSFSQERLWFLDQMEPGRTTYVIPGAVEMLGALDAPALERALGALVSRHESLRTIFVTVEGRPLQVVAEPGAWTLPVADLSGDVEALERLEQLLRREVSRGFDLARGPLFRARLYRLAADRHVLLLAMHHIISDGWSMGILFRELGELYGRFCWREAATLPALRLQYRDFARWQRSWLRGEALEHLLAHWRSRLAGAPQVLELPVDRPRPAEESHRGALYSFTLPLELTEALRRFARREDATLYMTLLAGFALLLSRYSGRPDFLVGTPVANRNRAELEEMAGFFVNTLVLRANLTGRPSASEFLGRMREVCLDAFAHQDLPFERLVEETRPARDLSRNPLVQVMFALQNAPLRPLELPGLKTSPLDVDPGVAQVDLTLQVQETAQGLSAMVEYAIDLFDPPTIERMATHWRSLLEAMVASPEARVSELALLTEAERQQLLVEWNQTTVDYPRDSCVHELFELQAQRTPDAKALTFGDQHLTYRELDRRSNQLAWHLGKLGAGPGGLVGICLERSLEMVVGLLGILKAGAAYVPLDPSFPENRLRFMADDAQLDLLVSTASPAAFFVLPRERQVLLDDEAQSIASAPETRLPTEARRAQAGDPAYIIYTSGSTGKPKGVVVPHGAVVNFLTSMAREPGLAVHDVLVAVTTLSFDIAVLELLLPLTLGAKVVVATRDETIDGRALGSLLERHRATVMQATPVTWRLLLEAEWSPTTAFKALVGGEAMPKDLADELIARGVELWNMYGPTETTVWSTCARIDDTSSGITIGQPIANTCVRILDAQRNLCPIGVAGELCLGGAGVALGYWNRPELTADRFIPDPFSASPGGRLYRTGDRARWRNDGRLEHLGRLDFQVKLRGFRIEVGEIEAGIAQHPLVREVAVIAREDTPGEKRLVAYLVAENPPADLADQLRARLRAALPKYMVPAQFVLLQALPRTDNGKLDRNSLPAPSLGDGPPRGAIVAPRTATEEMVLGTFRAVLDRSNFGVFDNFFDLGGHSLMAARLMSQLRSASGVDLPLRDLFARPTVAGLAEAIDALRWLKTSKAPARRAGEREEILL